MAKIIQILIAPNDNIWQGRLLGLGDDGVTYQTGCDKWEPMIPCPNDDLAGSTKEIQPEGPLK